MLVFLDETFRKHRGNRKPFGALAGVAIPQDIYSDIQHGVFRVRRPYHGTVLNEEDELRGSKLLRDVTFRVREKQGWSYQWNLVEELLQYARSQRLRVFGVVCFDESLHTFSCADEMYLDRTYRYLLERIDRYMKREFPRRYAKLIFDDRGIGHNRRNARALVNFFNRSPTGRGYDSIVRDPFFGVSDGHCVGVQIADVITTVVGKRFEGDKRIQPLWEIVKDMIYYCRVGELNVSSIKVIRESEIERKK